MSEEDHWVDPEEEKKKTPKITHRIMLDDSVKVKDLRDELEKTKRQNYAIALKHLEKLKDEARSLGMSNEVISAIKDPENLQKLVDAKKSPQFATPENKGSGGSGTIPLFQGQGVISRPDAKQGSVEQWQDFYEQKLIAKINSLKSQNLDKEEISKETIKTLNTWREQTYKNPAFFRVAGPVTQTNQNKGVEKLAKKVWDFMLKNTEKIKQGSYEP